MTREPKTIPEAFGELRQDFRAASETRFTSRIRGVAPGGSGADYHYRSERDYLHMIERARHYVRNDMVVGQGVRRLASNVMQGGFMPDPKTGDDDLDRALKDEHEAWSGDTDLCHSEGELTLSQIERLAFTGTLVDGDVFFLLRNDGKIQAVEGHRPRTPRNTRRNVVHGILLDDNARRQEVWISKESLSPHETLSRVSDVVPYEFRDSQGHRQVLQTYFPSRFSQRRGVTALAPVCDTIGMHDDLQFSTLVKAQLAALVVIFREQTKDSLEGAGGPSLGSGVDDDDDEPVQKDAQFRPIPSVRTGLDVRLPPGEKATGFTPGIPNPEFFPHSSLLLTFIAVNLDLPVHVLLLDPSKTNFSGWRGAIDQARMRFRDMQRDMVSRFHAPLWSWRVRNLIRTVPSIRKMAARTGVRPFHHEWDLPAWPYIEPLKDAQADDLCQSRFLNSPTRIQTARGRAWPVVADEIVRDKKLLISKAIEAAQDLNKTYPEADVSWREILGEGLNSPSPTIAIPPDNQNSGE